jgi:two-component system invasion response regulator UvrY
MQLSQEDGDFPPHLKILIADEHALVRRGLRECLQDFLAEDGLTPHIVETSSAHDAIAQIHAATWNLVILDLNLPDMPGLEMLRILKSVQPAAAALVLSIYTEEHYAARSPGGRARLPHKGQRPGRTPLGGVEATTRRTISPR